MIPAFVPQLNIYGKFTTSVAGVARRECGTTPAIDRLLVDWTHPDAPEIAGLTPVVAFKSRGASRNAMLGFGSRGIPGIWRGARKAAAGSNPPTFASEPVVHRGLNCGLHERHDL